MISIEGDDIYFQVELGKRAEPPEKILKVTDDQIRFQLYSKKNKISLAKNRVPADLAKCLDERISAGEEAGQVK